MRYTFPLPQIQWSVRWVSSGPRQENAVGIIIVLRHRESSCRWERKGTWEPPKRTGGTRTCTSWHKGKTEASEISRRICEGTTQRYGCIVVRVPIVPRHSGGSARTPLRVLEWQIHAHARLGHDSRANGEAIHIPFESLRFCGRRPLPNSCPYPDPRCANQSGVPNQKCCIIVFVHIIPKYSSCSCERT